MAGEIGVPEEIKGITPTTEKITRTTKATTKITPKLDKLVRQT